MNRNRSERCSSCGAPALVRMQGDILCARCGLDRSSSSAKPPRRRSRAVLLGLLSGGFVAKMLVGAVAVAAVGGVAAGVTQGARSQPEPTTTTTLGFVQIDAPAPQSVAPDALLQRVQEYADDVQQWGDCVSAAAREHSGGDFDPKQACGETPSASDHDLIDELPPGLDKADDKITTTADKADDKAATTADKADDKATKTADKADDKATKTADKADQSDDDE